MPELKYNQVEKCGENSLVVADFRFWVNFKADEFLKGHAHWRSDSGNVGSICGCAGCHHRSVFIIPFILFCRYVCFGYFLLWLEDFGPKRMREKRKINGRKFSRRLDLHASNTILWPSKWIFVCTKRISSGYLFGASMVRAKTNIPGEEEKTNE